MKNILPKLFSGDGKSLNKNLQIIEGKDDIMLLNIRNSYLRKAMDPQEEED